MVIQEILCGDCGSKLSIMQDSNRRLGPDVRGYQALLVCNRGHATEFELAELTGSPGVAIRMGLKGVNG
jgi:hypothetical protein